MTKRRVSAIGASVLALALGACGGGSSNKPSSAAGANGATVAPGGGSGGTSTNGGAPGSNRPSSEFCDGIYDLNNTRGLGPVVERLRKVTPPAEIADDWNDLLDGAVAFEKGDTSNSELMSRYSGAAGRVAAYYLENCPRPTG
jgi:hypothetical protein